MLGSIRNNRHSISLIWGVKMGSVSTYIVCMGIGAIATYFFLKPHKLQALRKHLSQSEKKANKSKSKNNHKPKKPEMDFGFKKDGGYDWDI